MRRRALLATTASSSLTLATAGCLTGDGTTPGTDDRSRTTQRTDRRRVEIGDSVDIPGTTVQVGYVDVQASFVERNWPTWNAHGSASHQYVVLDVSAADQASDLASDPPVSAHVDGDPVDVSGSAYAKFDGRKPTEFAAPIPPAPDADTAGILLHGTDHDAIVHLDDDLLERIHDPPELAATPNIPDSTSGGDLHYELDVENTGGSPGTLAATTTHDAIHDNWWTRTDTIDPGTTQTITFEPYGPTSSDRDDLEITLDWGLDSITKTVTIDGGTTTDGS